MTIRVDSSTAGGSILCLDWSFSVEVRQLMAPGFDDHLIEQAAQAVLHYFRTELGWRQVSVGEFTLALDRLLQGLGLVLDPDSNLKLRVRLVERDLRHLAYDAGKGGELCFFPMIRREVTQVLTELPAVLRFRGLRGCVKQLCGARRWNRRCAELNLQIIAFLRSLLAANRGSEVTLIIC
jgi:hypothetical protein